MSPDTFSGTIPEDRLYDPEWDMWVREEDGEVTIGATSYGVFLAGEIIGFTAKPCGAEVAAGRSLGTVECAKTVLAVHAPVSFVLTGINEVVEANAAPLNRDPYGAGWMVRGRPLAWKADRRRLVGGAEYRAHVSRLEAEARAR